MHGRVGTNVSELSNRSRNHVQRETSISDGLWVHLNGDEFGWCSFIHECVCVCVFFKGYSCEKAGRVFKHDPGCPFLFRFLWQKSKADNTKCACSEPAPESQRSIKKRLLLPATFPTWRVKVRNEKSGLNRRCRRQQR